MNNNIILIIIMRDRVLKYRYIIINKKYLYSMLYQLNCDTNFKKTSYFITMDIIEI